MISSRRRHRRAAAAGAALSLVIVAAIAAAGFAAFAAARSATLRAAPVRLSGPSGRRTARIAVTAGGQSVYWLSGESARHLKCTSAACMAIWPPVRVHGRPTGIGLSARLGTVRRGRFTQVTLGGHPVYTFAPDGGRRGIATGDGIRSFGGVWHVFRER